jgi:nonsense-mediated mRNA decay protein 3
MSSHSRMTQAEQHNILCCLCGVAIPPNPANMCLNCIQSQVDITEGIPKEEIIHWCRECERYLQPPKYWVACTLESKELLTICLKKIKGLTKVKLVDAKFLWTEPHSRRLKVKITIQKEVFNGTCLQQSFVVEYVIKNQQCEACQKSYTPHTWTAVVQVRQKVDHKRTFYYLEQLILRYNMHEKCINIKEESDGMDFYFGHKSHANKFADFVQSMCPTRMTKSERLITHDQKSNIFNFKYAFSIEICPICREDLLCLPPKLSKSLGGIGPLVLCQKINNKIHFLDPVNMQQGEITSNVYWKHPFTTLMDIRRLVEFTVLDVELLHDRQQHQNTGSASVFSFKNHQLAEIQLMRSEDMGGDDDVIFVKSHLGNILKSGDSVLCYDLKNAAYNENGLRELKLSNIPEVIIVKKIYKRNKERNWKLRKLDKVESDDKKNSSEKDRSKREREYEKFLQELEEDSEMRSKIDLIKRTDIPASKTTNGKYDEEEESDSGDELPDVPDEELKDEQELEMLRRQKAEEDDQNEEEYEDNVEELTTNDNGVLLRVEEEEEENDGPNE